jgi:hypothetical protein
MKAADIAETEEAEQSVAPARGATPRVNKAADTAEVMKAGKQQGREP